MEQNRTRRKAQVVLEYRRGTGFTRRYTRSATTARHRMCRECSMRHPDRTDHPRRPAGQRVQHATRSRRTSQSVDRPITTRISSSRGDSGDGGTPVRPFGILPIIKPAPPYPARAADGSAHSFPAAAEPGGILWRAQKAKAARDQIGRPTKSGPALPDLKPPAMKHNDSRVSVPVGRSVSLPTQRHSSGGSSILLQRADC